MKIGLPNPASQESLLVVCSIQTEPEEIKLQLPTNMNVKSFNLEGK